jgi:hypothetical protein
MNNTLGVLGACRSTPKPTSHRPMSLMLNKKPLGVLGPAPVTRRVAKPQLLYCHRVVYTVVPKS